MSEIFGFAVVRQDDYNFYDVSAECPSYRSGLTLVEAKKIAKELCKEDGLDVDILDADTDDVIGGAWMSNYGDFLVDIYEKEKWCA